MNIALIQAIPHGELRPQLGYGIAFLKSYALNLNPEWRIDLFLNDEEFSATFNPLDYDIIGISSVTNCFNEVKELARDIKSRNPDAPLVIGGSHITAFPASVEHDFFDVGVVGEGEVTFHELVSYISGSRKFDPSGLDAIKGLCFVRDGKVCCTERRELIKDIDSIPPIDKSFLVHYKALPITHTSRGCPFNCKYCQSHAMWNSKLRLHSPEYVLREILELRSLYPDDNRLIFKDDTFTANRKVLRAIQENLAEIKAGRELVVVGSSHVNYIDEEWARVLAAIGVRKLNFGIESGSERVMRILKRECTTLEKVDRALDLCHANNIKSSSAFLIGTPEDTEADLITSYEFILERLSSGKLWEVGTLVLAPLPDVQSEYWNIAVKKYNIDHKTFDWGRLDIRGWLYYLSESQNVGSIDDWWRWRTEKIQALYIGSIPEDRFIRLIEPYEIEMIRIVQENIAYDRKHKY